MSILSYLLSFFRQVWSSALSSLALVVKLSVTFLQRRQFLTKLDSLVTSVLHRKVGKLSIKKKRLFYLTKSRRLSVDEYFKIRNFIR